MWGSCVSSRSGQRRAYPEILWLALLFAAAFVVYLPSLPGPLIWDDSYLVHENPFFKSPIFFFEVFRHYLFLDSFSVYYRPVQNLSYMPDYWIWSDEPFGYHLSNVILHALTGCLLYALLRSILPSLAAPGGSGSPPAAPAAPGGGIPFFVAMTWVIHPIHNAAVAYISGRADTLAALFAIAAWLLYMKTAAGGPFRKWMAGIGAALSALAAVCSKEIALLWMVLFTLHLLVFEKSRPLRQRAAAIACLAGIVLFYAWLRHLPPARQPLPPDAPSAFAARFLLMLRALGDYAGLLFCPLVLRMDRAVFVPEAYRTAASWQQNIGFEYLSLLGASTLALICYCVLKPWPGRKIRLFGAAWFLIGFLPISNLFPLNAQVAEHWIYMPSAGFLLFLAGCAVPLPARWRGVLAGVVMLWMAALGVRTWVRSEDWADPARFYRAAMAAGSDSARIRMNLAMVYSASGDNTGAEKELRTTVEKFPDFAPARINLGVILMKEGKKAEAARYLQASAADADDSAKRYPHSWSAALTLSEARYSAGQIGDASKMVDDAIRRYPENWELVKFKSRILSETNHQPEAMALVRSWTATHWWHYDSWVTLGRLLITAGRMEEAIDAMERASRLDIHASEPFSLLADSEWRGNQPEAAYEWEMKAIGRSPDKPLEYVFLSSILDRLGRKEESARALHKAEEMAGGSAAKR